MNATNKRISKLQQKLITINGSAFAQFRITHYGSRTKLDATSQRKCQRIHGVLRVFSNLENGSLITTAITVVRSRKDCYQVAPVTPIVPFHYYLVSTTNKIETILLVERCRHVLTESVAGASCGGSPTLSLLWVRPQ